MRVLHVVSSLHRENGGLPAVVVHLAVAQRAAGLSTAIACRDSRSLKEHVQWWTSQVLGFPGVEIIPCGLWPPGTARAVRDFDVVHVHGVWQPLPTLACWQAERSETPVVVAPHGMLSAWSLAHKRPRKTLALALIWERLIRSTTYLHALNAAEAEELRTRFPGTRAHVIPNGIALDEFADMPAAGEAARVVPALRRGRRFVLFLARLHVMKAPDLLVEAFGLLAHSFPDLDLVIAGPDFGMERELRALVERAGLARRVHFPGAIFGRAKLALLKDALCVCQPSRHEGFSVSMLEALACSVPVITTRTANFPEIGSEGAGTIVEPDARSLAAAIARLANDGALREQQSRAARGLILRRFTWGAIEPQTRLLYEQAIAAAAGSIATEARVAGRS